MIEVAFEDSMRECEEGMRSLNTSRSPDNAKAHDKTKVAHLYSRSVARRVRTNTSKSRLARIPALPRADDRALDPRMLRLPIVVSGT